MTNSVGRARFEETRNMVFPPPLPPLLTNRYLIEQKRLFLFAFVHSFGLGFFPLDWGIFFFSGRNTRLGRWKEMATRVDDGGDRAWMDGKRDLRRLQE